MSFIAVGGTLLAGGAVGAGTKAAGVGLAGAGLTAIGANKQAKATAAAQDKNYQQFLESERNNWRNYLMQRGINPNGAETGQLPANATPINSRLPLWMSVSVPGGAPAAGATTPRRRLVPIGAATPTAVVAPAAVGG